MASSISCASCNKVLFPPIFQSSSKLCFHNFHQKCFIEMLGGACRICNVKITEGTDNPKLERIMVRLERLAKPLINNHTFDAFNDKLLHEAVKEGDQEAVFILLHNGVSVSALVEGRSPLYIACKYHQVDVARVLLERGADVAQKNNLNIKELGQYFRINDHDSEHEATPMKAAAVNGDKEMVELLLSYGASLNEAGAYGRSALFLAIHAGHEELALFLMEKGADIKRKDHFGCTMLMAAVDQGSCKIVQELVARKVDINETNHEGNTPLHVAAGKEKPELLICLLQNGAKKKIDALWLGTWTPLACAITHHHVDNVKILIEHGANLNIKSKQKSVLEFARDELRDCEDNYYSCPNEKTEKMLKKSREIVAILSHHGAKAMFVEDDQQDEKSWSCAIS